MRAEGAGPMAIGGLRGEQVGSDAGERPGGQARRDRAVRWSDVLGGLLRGRVGPRRDVLADPCRQRVERWCPVQQIRQPRQALGVGEDVVVRAGGDLIGIGQTGVELPAATMEAL